MIQGILFIPYRKLFRGMISMSQLMSSRQAKLVSSQTVRLINIRMIFGHSSNLFQKALVTNGVPLFDGKTSCQGRASHGNVYMAIRRRSPSGSKLGFRLILAKACCGSCLEQICRRFLNDVLFRKYPKMNLKLRAPLELENLLPYNLEY